MGNKSIATGLRIGIVEDWRSKWVANKREFGNLLVADQKIRRFVKNNFKYVGIPKVEIERTKDNVTVILHAARPGVIIGKRGSKVELLETELAKIAGAKVTLKIIEVQNPELEAQLVAEGIAEQLVKRASFRRTMKRAVEVCSQAGAKGIKIIVSGRLGGAEIARTEKMIRGGVPLHTLRCMVDYGFAEAHTTYGIIGVKVWINKGEVISEKEVKRDGLDAETNEVPEKPTRKNSRGRTPRQ